MHYRCDVDSCAQRASTLLPRLERYSRSLLVRVALYSPASEFLWEISHRKVHPFAVDPVSETEGILTPIVSSDSERIKLPQPPPTNPMDEALADGAAPVNVYC